MQNPDTRSTPSNGAPNGTSTTGTSTHGTSSGLHTNAADTAEIRRDLEQLKSSVSTLTRHLQADGKARASEIKGAVNEGISSLLDQGDVKLREVEGKVKENPRGAVVVAFCAGMLANILLRRR